MTQSKRKDELMELARKLIELLQKDPTLRDQLFETIAADRYVRRDELTQVLHEIKELRVESIKRFEAMQKQMDERFEAMQKQMDERFEESKRRFEAMQKQIDERFAAVDERFDRIDRRLDEFSLALGHDFEEFNSYWLETFLIERGYPKIRVQKRHFYDKDYSVFPDSNDVEIDLFNEDPLVIGEVTAIVRSITKVTVFLRKLKFLEDLFERKAEYKVFITYLVEPEIREEIERLLKKHGVQLFMLRRSYEDR